MPPKLEKRRAASDTDSDALSDSPAPTVKMENKRRASLLSAAGPAVGLGEAKKRRKSPLGEDAETENHTSSHRAGLSTASVFGHSSSPGGSTRKREAEPAGGDFSALSKAFQDIMHRPLPPASSASSPPAAGHKAVKTEDGRVKSESGVAPILAERPGVFKELEKQREEARVQRRLLAARRHQREASHVKPCAADREYERSLRKIASKGVVRFFNVLMKFRREQAERDGEDLRQKRLRRRERFQRRKGKKADQGDSRKTQNFMKMLNSE
ncbi:hypothetical protein BESB_071180 [Besnoitia besnoiti]|uniref:Rrp15p n=1 Tax=Besnoitia besnoiti TaxID=94643 RepID=A0A2A9MDD5_BESBE|nr:uncharacterized protein BESB_071180 [Besnoitia besnoiti]PFH33966.1 hypothetical protein BESB_071180 [Besnoitia besnoiti]